MSPITAGWKEFADFPGLGLRRVKVKLDTGARSAALGARAFTLFEAPGGHEVELHFAPYRRHPERMVTVRLPVVGFKTVKATTGVAELRPVIEVRLRLGPVTKTIRATIADRSRMLVPVLLGRNALAPEIVVDPGQKYLLQKKRNADDAG
jgi:hypothetical protein